MNEESELLTREALPDVTQIHSVSPQILTEHLLCARLWHSSVNKTEVPALSTSEETVQMHLLCAKLGV